MPVGSLLMTLQNSFDYFEISDIPKEFSCEVCTYPLVNPQSSNPCGHTICGTCADYCTKHGSNKCHMCRQLRTGFCRNMFAEQMLEKVEARCKGCKAKVLVKNVSTHARQCPDIELECTLCYQRMRRRDEQHHRDVCPKEEVTCDCGDKMQREKETSHKSDACRLAEIDCPLSCGTIIKRYLVPSHCSVCPKVAEQCEVNGCGQQIRREGKHSHLKDNLQRHFDLVTREKGKILWKTKMGSLSVAPERSMRDIVIMNWVLQPATGPLASPYFEKFERKWRLFLDGGILRLKYVQGLDDIAIVASFLLKTHDGKIEAFREVLPSFVLLKEGEYLQVDTQCSGTPPQSITAKIQKTEPAYK